MQRRTKIIKKWGMSETLLSFANKFACRKIAPRDFLIMEVAAYADTPRLKVNGLSMKTLQLILHALLYFSI